MNINFIIISEKSFELFHLNYWDFSNFSEWRFWLNYYLAKLKSTNLKLNFNLLN